MANSLDLLILPILRQEGEIQADIPGLHIAKPPRRADRRRVSERLIVYLTLQGNAPLSPSAYQQLLRGLVSVYYKTPGSATAALQKVTEVLNNYLRDRNMRGASRGLRAVGLLTQIVLRSDTAYIAQSGPSHIFVVNPGHAVDYHDPEMAGRGLGISRVPKVRFHQEQLTENDLLLVTPAPPPVWSTATLINLSRMQMKSRYHRLLHRLEEDVNAVLVMPQKGSGEIRILRPKFGEEGPPPDVETAPKGEPEPEQGDDNPLTVLPGIIGKSESPDVAPFSTPHVFPDSQPRAEQPQHQPDTPAPHFPQAEQEPHRSAFAEKIRQLPIGRVLGTIGSATRNALSDIAINLSTLAKRILPDDKLLDFPEWVPGLVAVAVPIMVVAIASVVYAEKKVERVFSEYYQKAQVLIEQADTTKDTAEYYQAIRSAYESLEVAHIYKETEESLALYQQVIKELDTLDRVTRLGYRSLFSQGLGDGVNITEIVINSYGDLYLLNETTGKVIRVIDKNGYQIDEDFNCGPVPFGHVEVGKLVDIVSLPPDREDGATILGIDSAHTMILCGQTEGENSIFEDTSYTLTKGIVKAMTISSGDLGDIYILSPVEELVLIEYARDAYRMGTEYFGGGDHPLMTDTIDLAANLGELYLLHADSHITRCIKTENSLSCDAPFAFSDDRLGRTSGPVFEGANFATLKYMAYLGKMLYLMDPEQQAIYYFNPQLEYQKQFRPERELLGGPATAFTVHMHETIFLAVGNRIYKAEIE